MSRRYPGWYCRECGANSDPETEREDDGTLVVTCPACGAVEVHRPQAGGHHV